MIRTLLAQVRQYRKAALLAPLFTALEVLMEVLIPFVTAAIIDQGIQVGNMGQVYRYGLLMLALALVSLCAGVLAGRFSARASAGFACNLRDAMYENIQTNAMLGVMVLASSQIGGRSARYFTQQQKDLGAVNGYIEEMMDDQKVVKVFCHEEKSVENFRKLNQALRDSADKANTFANIAMPVNGNLGNISYVLCAIVGALLALSGYTGLTLGTLVAFLNLNKNATQPVSQISQQTSSVVMAMAGAQRVFDLMDAPPERDEGYVELVNAKEDLIVLCGARVGDRAIALPNQIAEQAKVIHIDIDPAEIGKNMRVDVPIVGDVKQVLAALAEKVQPVECRDWVERVLRYKREFVPRGQDREDTVEPRSFIRALSAMMEEDAILTADPGQGQIWAAINFTQKEGRFLTSGGLGTMGYALPTALGAKLAKPRRQVLAVCGDGAFQMSLCELATVAASHAPLKVVVFDNRRLGMVREYQNSRYARRHIGTHMDGNPDFVALCQAYGIPAALAKNNREAERLAKEMLQSPRPYVLVDPETPSV